MAELYAIIGSVSTIELIGSGSTRPIRLVTARAEPSGFVYTFRVVKGDFQPSHVNLIAHDIAQALNKDADVPGVVDVSIYQDVDNAGQYVSKATVTVESTSGDSEEDVSMPYGSLFGADFAKRVGAARKNLDEIEEL